VTAPRLPRNDPRTLARDIPGLFEAVFPHLVPGVVAHLNRQAFVTEKCNRVSQEAVAASSLSRAMLFELSVALAEQLLLPNARPDWEAALALAIKRQRRHFDARTPESLQEVDKDVALQVAENLALMLTESQTLDSPHVLVVAPKIPGYQWISSTVGDFSVGTTLIEVKCTNSNFSSADYRQILMYWLLSYAGALEHGTDEWCRVTLMNPRRCTSLTIASDQLVRLLGAGRSKVEVLELFATIVGERRTHKHH
jgi:hypothetical protein